MRLEWVWVGMLGGLAACGTTSASTETDGNTSSSSSTTSVVTSNDGENSTTPMPTSADDTATSTLGTTSGSTSSSGDETAAQTTSTGDGTTTESSGSESSGSSGSDGSTTGEAVAPCLAGCMTEFACSDNWKSVEACDTACEANLVEAGLFSAFCQTAWSDLSACFGTLTCEEYAEYLSPTMFPYPCSTESDSLAFECEGQ